MIINAAISGPPLDVGDIVYEIIRDSSLDYAGPYKVAEIAYRRKSGEDRSFRWRVQLYFQISGNRPENRVWATTATTLWFDVERFVLESNVDLEHLEGQTQP